MRDVYEVLREKEEDCARLRKEIEALRLAGQLMEEASDVAHSEQGSLRGSGPAGATQAVNSQEGSLRERAQSQEGSTPTEAELRRDEASETERKAPLSATLTESPWWRRKTGR